MVVVSEDDESETRDETDRAGTVHTEIQYLLAKLGADMGFDVHVASNDQGRTWKRHRLGDMPRRRERLPHRFDPVTNRTIELIDVLWLDGNAIVAAFEIESTTSIYSGLLRMSDLLARQPNISVPLFLVAPEDSRDQVIRQSREPYIWWTSTRRCRSTRPDAATPSEWCSAISALYQQISSSATRRTFSPDLPSAPLPG